MTKIPPLKQPSEAQITKSIRNLLASMNIFHWKVMQGLGCEKGVPDIMGIIPSHINKARSGHLLGIEVKTLRGKLSDHQSRFIDRINREGGLAFVARSVDDVIDNLGIRDRFLF